MNLETIKQIAAIAEEYKARLAEKGSSENEADILDRLDYRDLRNATGVYTSWGPYANVVVYTIKDIGERVMWAVSDNGGPLQQDEIRLSDGRRGRIVHDMRLFSLPLASSLNKDYKPQWLLTMAGMQIPEGTPEISPEEVARLTGLSVPGAEFIELSPEDFDTAWAAREFAETCYRYVDNLPTVKSRHVKTMLYSTDKLAEAIFNEKSYGDENYNEEIESFLVTAITDIDKIKNIAAIQFEELPDNIKLTRSLNSTDERVFNSVWSIWNAGNKMFSLSQVARLSVSGKEISDAWMEQVKNSIRKLQSTFITIDNTAEIDAGHKYLAITQRDEPMLRLISAVVRFNGAEERVYKLDGEPLLGKYSHERGRFFEFPARSFALNPSSRKSIQLEDYIVHRVKAMGGKMRNTILLRTVYDEMGLTGREKAERQETRRKLIKILENLKANHVISDYKIDVEKVTIFPIGS